MKLKYKIKKVIQCHDWDKLVREVYKRPYCYQQQGGCQDRGVFNFSVPCETAEDYEAETIPEVVNGQEMGVKFSAWLARDPNQNLKDDSNAELQAFHRELWWNRNFYPDFQTLANDLHAKGLLEEGDYSLVIDW